MNLVLAMRQFCSKPQDQASGNMPFQEPEVTKEVMDGLKEQIKKITQCMSLGQYKDAQGLLGRYKNDLERYFPKDHPAYLSYENNQGVLWRLNGHFEDSYDLLSSVYNRYSKMLGKDHPSTISACINVATVLRDLKDYPQSVKYFEEALQARLSSEGEDSPNYGILLGMSAGSYRLNGDTKTAYRNLKDAYVVMAKHHRGEECLPCAVILNSMGLLYKQEGKHERACDAYERCLAVREKILGGFHPDTLATRHNLAELYTIWGKPEEAKKIIEENLKQMEELKKKQAESHGHDHDHDHDGK